MTTVAAKAGVFAADTQLSGGGTINRVSKLMRLPDGGVVGGAGTWHQAYQAMKWMAAGEHGDCPVFEDATLMIGKPDGSLWLAEGCMPPYPLLNDASAIGSGAQAAQAGMLSGKSALQSVEDVIGVDRGTSGPVETMKVRRK